MLKIFTVTVEAELHKAKYKCDYLERFTSGFMKACVRNPVHKAAVHDEYPRKDFVPFACERNRASLLFFHTMGIMLRYCTYCASCRIKILLRED